MKWIAKIALFLFLLACFSSYGQEQSSYYQRELQGVTDQWHKVVLPDDIFEQLAPDLSDLRILGVTAQNDTIEVPYLLRVLTEKVVNKEVSFQLLNTAHNEKGYYFTFEVPTPVLVNQIKLDFEQQNFDWKLQLEGSQDQNDWFTIVEDYRILAIKNRDTDFRFTEITFPNSRYRYFRMVIQSNGEPKLTIASMAHHEVAAGSYNTIALDEIVTSENKANKQTEIEFELSSAMPISRLKIEVLDTIDYYRPLTIKYLADSVETDKGWKYNYHTLGTGILNSLGENEFKPGSSSVVRKMKILIHNQDNRPLSIGEVEADGYVHELVARFTEEANYYLVYGNKSFGKPHYDISRFQNKIPQDNKALDLGEPQVIAEKKTVETVPLFKNKTWLWVIMIIIILLLGWFSLRMMKSEEG